MTTTINIGGVDVAFRASGATLRRYREKFNRDLLEDFNEITSGNISSEVIYKLQDLAYIMAKQADDSVPEDVDTWIDGFDVFPFNEVAPKIITLWQNSNITTVDPKNGQNHRKEK
jgi:hypothetical protein